MAFDITSYILGKKSAGGGGGSSDFTTATVTVTNNAESDLRLNQCPCCVEANAISEGVPAMVVDAFANTSNTFTVPLYKGACMWIVDTDNAITTTGNIVNFGGPMYLITGDGTITIS